MTRFLGYVVAGLANGTIYALVALGVVVERAFVGPVRSRGTLHTLVMTVGVLLLLTEATVQFWGPNTPPIPSIFPDDSIRFGGTGVSVHQFAAAGFVLVL